MQSRLLWRDGALVPWGEANVSVLAHSLQRGSAVFDVLSFREGDRGICVFRLHEHVDRFLRSAAIVGLDVEPSREALCRATCDVVRASGLASGLVRIVGCFAVPEGDLVPTVTRASVAIAAYAPGDFPARHKAGATVRVKVPDDTRKAGPEVVSPQAKVAAAYLGPMIARARALAEGFDEVVLLDREGAIAEAPTANVFAVIDDTLATPPLDRVLAGITRDAIVQIAREEGIATAEAKFGLSSFRRAREAFLAATSYNVKPIAAVDGSALEAAPGPITARLSERLEAIAFGRDDRFAHWLTPIL
jgi:branched-chain amino acid aminotransferase